MRSLHPRLRLKGKQVERVVHVLDARLSDLRRKGSTLGPSGELSIAFLTDKALAELHGQFLDDWSKTDVITFEGSPELGSAGEICVSVDAAVRFAHEAKGSFSEELTLYIVHGWLHLAGHDDLSPAPKRRMRLAEKKALKLLRAAKAMPQFRLKPDQKPVRARV